MMAQSGSRSWMIFSSLRETIFRNPPTCPIRVCPLLDYNSSNVLEQSHWLAPVKTGLLGLQPDRDKAR